MLSPVLPRAANPMHVDIGNPACLYFTRSLLVLKPARSSVKSILGALVLVLVIVLGFVFTTFGGISHVLSVYDHQSKSRPCRVYVQPERREHVVSVAFTVSKTLGELAVDNALCYGSLQGALKYGRMLSTEDHVDLCVVDSQMEGVSSIFVERLSRVGLVALYDSRQGEISITQQGQPTTVDVRITLFYRAWRGTARRAGFARWLLSFFNRDSLDAFPQVLLEGPFQFLTFEGRRMPVPHGDGKILRSMYPDDWWEEHVPHYCPNRTSYDTSHGTPHSTSHGTSHVSSPPIPTYLDSTGTLF